MDAVIIIAGAIITIIGILGCILPSLPGPPINYAALLLLGASHNVEFSTNFYIIYLVVTIIVLALDYIIPTFGGKYFGVSKYGVWGSFIGMMIGVIFFPPFGMIAGVMIGAVAGELAAGKENSAALKAGFATFVLSIFMIGVKLSLSLLMTYHFVKESVGVIF
jgi:uncharacterized protein YqgC (DUF456 family)